MSAKIDKKKEPTSTGEKLALYMLAHGISKRELSRRTGVYVNTITRIIRGDKVGNLYTWLTIADAMGCTLDDILFVSEKD